MRRTRVFSTSAAKWCSATRRRSIVITDLEKLTGVAVRGIHGDKGYRGHKYPDRFRVWISGQVRRVTKVIRRETRRRAAVEPVIGHLKDDHRMRRNYIKGRDGDRINAVLAAAEYNFSLTCAGSRSSCASYYWSSVAAVRRNSCLPSLALGNILHGRSCRCGLSRVDLAVQV